MRAKNLARRPREDGVWDGPLVTYLHARREARMNKFQMKRVSRLKHEDGWRSSPHLERAPENHQRRARAELSHFIANCSPTQNRVEMRTGEGTNSVVRAAMRQQSSNSCVDSIKTKPPLFQRWISNTHDFGHCSNGFVNRSTLYTDVTTDVGRINRLMQHAFPIRDLIGFCVPKLDGHN